MTRTIPLVITLIVVALAACDDTPDDDSQMVLLPDAEVVADADPPPDRELPPDMFVAPALPRASEWCSFASPVVPTDRPLPLQWSDAHGLARLFGPHDDGGRMDSLLARALHADDPVAEYGRQVPFVCAVAAAPLTALPPARVVMEGEVAHVYPGAGPLEVPEDAAAIVLDLTELTEHADLWDALSRASAAVLPEPALRLGTVRTFDGLPFALAGRDGVYAEGTAQVELDPWPGAAPERPVVIAVTDVQPPLVADLAASARAAGLAALAGAPVFAAQVESRPMPVGDAGLLIRWIVRVDDQGVTLPDVIAPDGYDATALLAEPLPLEPLAGAVERSDFGLLGYAVPGYSSSSEAHHAALVITHGLLSRFDPHYAANADAVDDALVELVSEHTSDEEPTHADGVDRLDRLLAATHDGSAWTLDARADNTTAMPVLIDFERDWTPFVQRSTTPEVGSGWLIDTIDGMTASAWFMHYAARTAAPDKPYLQLATTRHLVQADDPVTIGFTDTAGLTHELELEPSRTGLHQLSTEWTHATGTLDAYGAPDVLYVDLTFQGGSDSEATLNAALAANRGARALVLDLRGIMSGNHYFVARQLIADPGLDSPIFRVMQWTGPDLGELDSNQYVAFGTPEGFAGPIVVLTSTRTVGSSENFALMLTPYEQVRFVGRTTAGVNGNSTGVALPGSVGVYFVGMDVFYPDGATFSGVGIPPDLEVWPTAAAGGAGRDEVLEAAVEMLLDGAPSLGD